MAEYPAGNPGIAPPDIETDVGQFRALTGDLNYEPYNPAVEGVGNYQKFSDSEIEAYLAQGEGSVPRAVGFSYLYLAGQAAIDAKSIKDYDLAVDTTKRADGLLAIADIWFGKADAGDADYFDIVPVGYRAPRRPEATQWPVRRIA